MQHELCYFHFVTQKGSLDKLACLTNFSPMFHFYTPQKHQKMFFFFITLSTLVILTASIYLSKHSTVETLEHCVKYAKGV